MGAPTCTLIRQTPRGRDHHLLVNSQISGPFFVLSLPLTERLKSHLTTQARTSPTIPPTRRAGAAAAAFSTPLDHLLKCSNCIQGPEKSTNYSCGILVAQFSPLVALVPLPAAQPTYIVRRDCGLLTIFYPTIPLDPNRLIGFPPSRIWVRDQRRTKLYLSPNARQLSRLGVVV